MLVQALGNLVSFLKRPSSSLDSRCFGGETHFWTCAGMQKCKACKSAKSGISGIWKAFHFILGPYVNTNAGRKGHGTASRPFHMLLFTKNCAIRPKRHPSLKRPCIGCRVCSLESQHLGPCALHGPNLVPVQKDCVLKNSAIPRPSAGCNFSPNQFRLIIPPEAEKSARGQKLRLKPFEPNSPAWYFYKMKSLKNQWYGKFRPIYT